MPRTDAYVLPFEATINCAPEGHASTPIKSGRNFWPHAASGAKPSDFTADTERGAAIAREFLDALTPNNLYLLAWIARDQGGKSSGLTVGFWGEIARAALASHAGMSTSRQPVPSSILAEG